MIESLYIFTKGLFVVAKEWNANFKAIKKSNDDCAEAIDDANNQLAFINSDLTQLKSAYRALPNSFLISGTSIAAQVGNEYYKTLANSEDLAISIPNINGEYRFQIKTQNQRTLDPLTFLFNGQVTKKYIMNDYYYPGVKFVFVWVSNGVCYVKMGATE